MSAQLVPSALQSRHWYEYVIGVLPSHSPFFAVRVFSSRASPSTVGSDRTTGRHVRRTHRVSRLVLPGDVGTARAVGLAEPPLVRIGDRCRAGPLAVLRSEGLFLLDDAFDCRNSADDGRALLLLSARDPCQRDSGERTAE